MQGEYNKRNNMYASIGKTVLESVHEIKFRSRFTYREFDLGKVLSEVGIEIIERL